MKNISYTSFEVLQQSTSKNIYVMSFLHLKKQSKRQCHQKKLSKFLVILFLVKKYCKGDFYKKSAPVAGLAF